MRPISSSVVKRPRPKRSVVPPSGRPSAASTCDGPLAPLVHADRVEQATPARAGAIRSPSASSSVTCRLLGSRWSGSTAGSTPVSRAAGAASRIAVHRRSRRRRVWAASRGQFVDRQRQRRGQADDARHVERAAAQAAFVAAAFEERQQRAAAPHVEPAGALRAVHLVRR